MSKIVDIVTGASQGIGKAIAESVAHRRHQQMAERGVGYRLVLVGRNQERGNQVASAIQQETGLAVEFEACDVSDFSSVMDLQGKILQTDDDGVVQVGISVNNAAECPPPQQKFVEIPRKTAKNNTTKEQVDKQFAINVLGYHFMLTAFSTDFSDETHVINIASNWAGDLDLKDLNLQRRRYDNDSAYRQSKQCDRMLSVGWAKRLASKSVKVNACHPGDPCTVLSRALGYNLYASAPTRNFIDRSGVIPFLCGFSSSSESEAVQTSGKWYDGSQSPATDHFASNAKKIEDLMDICDSFCVAELRK